MGLLDKVFGLKFQIKNNRRGFSRLPWTVGGARTIRDGTGHCRLGVSKCAYLLPAVPGLLALQSYAT